MYFRVVLNLFLVLQLIRKYKSVLSFILTFLGVYLLLSCGYAMYLKYAQSEVFYPDYITHRVAQHSESLINVLGYRGEIESHPTEASMKLYVNDLFVARVVEGCNAVSVLILFSAFILAFYQGFRTTLLFILGGGVLVYAVNIIRIAILSIGLYEYPNYKDVLHDVVFPGIIYGLVVVLWLFWIRRFKKQML
ncbi:MULTISPECIES: exosortase family protein XrtF [unclassified Leeuwenhoekiella]|uniref:exosortase family protein XrtF n=1 Tax=unclassified Leeuwenhoekiella TaxID=2615029 RepID=UPI0025B7C8D3|nr:MULTISPECIES: exosortase family protein XrtF [unclassified Leeuwenhoekiella]